MRSSLFISLVCLLFFIGCKTKHDYWSVSKFHVVSNALKEGEKCKIIYLCGPPGKNKDMDCYMHLIVVSNVTGDTVNVLSPFHVRYSNDDRKNDFSFEGDLESLQITQELALNKQFDNVNSIKGIKVRHFDKVFRVPKYDYLTNNHYPAVIGVMALVKPDKTTTVDLGE